MTKNAKAATIAMKQMKMRENFNIKKIHLKKKKNKMILKIIILR
jgi:hypothetical protein